MKKLILLTFALVASTEFAFAGCSGQSIDVCSSYMGCKVEPAKGKKKAKCVDDSSKRSCNDYSKNSCPAQDCHWKEKYQICAAD